MKKQLIIFFLLLSGWNYSQIPINDSVHEGDTIISRLQVYDGFDLPSNFSQKYKAALSRVRKVYPLALYAAEVVDSLDYLLEHTEKDRKKRKVARQTQKELKSEFKFLLKDLYVSEGKVLTKLIYRETGMTVQEIISKYKNGFSASLYSAMASLFDQNLDMVYKPNTDDFVIECVVQDIKSGKVAFDPAFHSMDKTEYKKSMKEYREDRKEVKKMFRKSSKKKRKKLREEKRKSRKERDNESSSED